MFRVRKEQLAVFSKLALGRFEARLALHLQQRFPTQCSAMAPDVLSELVKSAVPRGQKHGFLTEAQVAKFAELLVLLGPEFDGPAGPRWVKAIFADKSFLYPGQRLAALWEEVAQRSDATKGTEDLEDMAS